MLRIRRRWLRWLIASAAVVLLLFGLLQLVLATPWARNQVAAKLERRLGLEASIGRLAWSPWTGIEIHRLRVEKPPGLDTEPLLSVRRVRIWPEYSSLLGEQTEFEGVEVDGARLELDLELMVAWADRLMKEVEPPPVVALAQPGSPVAGPSRPPSVIPQPEVLPSDPIQPPGSAVATGAFVDPVAWLTLNDCEFVLRGGSTEWVRLRTLSGGVPLSGVADGGISGNLTLACSDPIETSVGIKLKRSRDGLINTRLTSSGKKWEVIGNGMLKVTSPVAFQTRGLIVLSDEVGFMVADGAQAKLEGLQARWQAVGILPFPASWAAKADCQVMGVDLTTGSFAGRVDEASGELRLHRGRLESPDFRLSGSPISVRGNGWLERGSGAVVARLTMPTALAGGAPNPCGEIRWRPLNPGSMGYADLTLWSDEERVWWVELGEDGASVPWDQWSRCLRNGPGLGR